MICLHCVVDNAPDTFLDRALLYSMRIKAPFINIAGGAQLDRAYAFADRVRQSLPTIKIFFRNLSPDDTGIFAKLSPQQWMDSRLPPERIEWAKRNNIVFVTDNESSGDDATMRRYVAWQVDVMNRLHMLGLHAANGRFATGNIAFNQYQLLKPMFDAMIPGDYFSPNEYLNAPNKSSNSHPFRYHNAWDVYGKPIPTVIGEYGIANDYNSEHGWHTVPGLTGKAYAQYLIENDKMWYAPYGVSQFLFAVGGYSKWETFQPDNDVYTELEAYAASHPSQQPPPVIAPPVITPSPSPDASAQRMQLLQQLATNNNQIAENSRANGTLIADNIKIISQLVALK